MRIDTPVQKLKGVGPKVSEQLAVRGIFTIADLLRFYPSGYDYFEDPASIAESAVGAPCTLCLTIVGSGTTFRRGARSISHFEASDGTGKVRLTFFNMPYLRQTLQPGASFIFRGMLRQTGNGNKYMDQPWFMDKSGYSRVKGTLQPRYPLVRGVGPARMRGFLANALEAAAGMRDILPAEQREKYGLIGKYEALSLIHFPTDRESLLNARRRLIFDEFFAFIIGIRRQKNEDGERINRHPMKADGTWCQRLLKSLPFELTDEQAGAWEEIKSDLSGKTLMNRLLQGDVGSGKTILAFLALILCAENGRQGALMAPTEVLARQHMEGLTAYLKESGLALKPVLLTGAVKGRARKEALSSIADGTADIVIGTHALFQEAVDYHCLGLVVTDEQHRFGVRQRTGLIDKGEDVPVLVMSATPIPRTLAIILYGELQVSSLRKLPPGRMPIKSLALHESQRGRAYRFILSEIKKGRQCYVICPAVEEGEGQEMENVAEYSAKLRAVLPDTIRIDSLTGRMKPDEKTAVMDAFASGSTDILVSTTVIEVGINVPNATVILVENAERFGLSQLHQLRGRVGRGKEQSYCIFLYTGKEKPDRLEILEQNTNGFDIAEKDLKARGPGDLFGVRQSGLPQFGLADLYEDSDLLRQASECADRMLREDPDFSCPEERRVDYSTI